CSTGISTGGGGGEEGGGQQAWADSVSEVPRAARGGDLGEEPGGGGLDVHVHDSGAAWGMRWGGVGWNRGVFGYSSFASRCWVQSAPRRPSPSSRSASIRMPRTFRTRIP